MRSGTLRWLALLLAVITLSACSARLEIVKDGPGDGRVASAPAGIDCGTACSASYANGALVTLTATPNAASILSEWQGCDVTAGSRCEVTVSGHRTVIPTFLIDDFAVDVTVVIDGRGVVADASVGFACDGRCLVVPEAGQAVALSAFPGPGWAFEAWSGACSGSDPSGCTARAGEDVVVTATFRESAAAQLQPGAVTAVACGDPPCAAAYQSTVRLRNAAGGYRGVTFVVVSPTLRLAGVSVPPAMNGCFAAAGPDKVIVVCPDDRIDNEDVAVLSLERTDDADGFVRIDEASVVTDVAMEPVAGAAVLVDGSP